MSDHHLIEAMEEERRNAPAPPPPRQQPGGVKKFRKKFRFVQRKRTRRARKVKRR